MRIRFPTRQPLETAIFEDTTKNPFRSSRVRPAPSWRVSFTSLIIFNRVALQLKNSSFGRTVNCPPSQKTAQPIMHNRQINRRSPISPLLVSRSPKFENIHWYPEKRKKHTTWAFQTLIFPRTTVFKEWLKFSTVYSRSVGRMKVFDNPKSTGDWTPNCNQTLFGLAWKRKRDTYPTQRMFNRGVLLLRSITVAITISSRK